MNTYVVTARIRPGVTMTFTQAASDMIEAINKTMDEAADLYNVGIETIDPLFAEKQP